MDAVQEALLEIRFTTSVLADLAVGRLSANPLWVDYLPMRLPMADIPFPVRQHDPNLSVLPTLELRAPDASRVVKLGEGVISFHVFQPYPGWLAFRDELKGVADFLFKNLSGVRATRLGIRYVNLFTVADHGVKGLEDLKVDVSVGGVPLQPPMLLTYTTKSDPDLHTTVKVGSKDFLINPSNAAATAVADIDAYTPGRHKADTSQGVLGWVERAHVALKTEFERVI